MGGFYWGMPKNGYSSGLTNNFLSNILLSSKKSRIRETPTLSTAVDSKTDTNLKRLRNLSKKKCCQKI